MSSRLLTPANQITILRLAFVPLFAILVIGRHYSGALAVLLVAALSDMLDGTIARLFEQETPLGIALDPIADKTLMTTAYLVLSFRGFLPWWLTVLVISRDAAILMTTLVISLVAGYRPFRPSRLGKASTAVQVTTIFVACSLAAHVPFVTRVWVRALVYLTACLTVASGAHYLLTSRHLYAHASEQVSSRASPEADTGDRTEDSAPVGSRSQSGPSRSP